ncbi:MAG TPA: rRNA maturation RNase YbeY [Candidatus Acidoferrales bacterium]|nr:rRNA maturation RNase YbeY [Candidatus Acidoferrales bacterium]
MVVNRQRRVPVAVRPLEKFLSGVTESLRVQRAVSVSLVSDSAMARMNQIYRGKAGPTDVLSFPFNGSHAGRASRAPHFHPTEDDAAGYLGDIAIAPETARRNARRSGRALAQELRILILHGVLHLMGYDHETDRGRMNRIERRWRRRFGLR